MILTRVQLVLAVVSALLVCGMIAWWIQLARVAGPADVSAGDAIPVVALAPGTVASTIPEGRSRTASTPLMPADLVARGWLSQTAIDTGIPVRALQAYAGAALVETARHPGCHVGWNTLAAIGLRESDHGTFHGASLDADGHESAPIIGPALTGAGGTKAVADSDGGVLDGDARADHAVGPMQLIPSTWARYAVDADGDGKPDPQQIDDAVLAAADDLCAAGGDLSVPDHWFTAIRAYNDNDAYVDAVRAAAAQYGSEAAR